MQTEQLIAPSYAELRPLKPKRSSAFPVHPALTDTLAAVAAAPLSFIARTFPLTRHLRFPVSLYDHLPRNYIDALTPPGVRSEFGD